MDYQKIGFKSGIECHQQLEGKKLFCSCPTLNLRNTKANITFERKLRAVIGETGEVDKAAAFEMAKGKKFIYEGDSKDCCLVEMDEEPPHQINPEAVKVALEVALMLKARIVDEIQVMRKTVVDGSNTTGFQRTALVAYDGVLETSKGKVRIPVICLEEEACQKLEESKEYTKYRLDRLGIPLIEIATAADIKDPEHAKETAENIGMILRSTGKVKRGIGTIRQDVNISIKGKNRVEIKGFQDVKSMANIIEKEVERQLKSGKKEEAHVRKVEADGSTSYMRPMPGAARMYPETDVMPFKADVSKIKLSELIEEKTKRFEKMGLGKDLAVLISKSDKIEMFEKFADQFKNVKPAFIAETLVPTLKELNRRYGVDTGKLTEKEFEAVFSALDKGNIPKNVVINVLMDLAQDKFESMNKYAGASEEAIKKEISNIVKQKPGLSIGAYMGIVMGKFKGKVDGKKVMEILKKLIK